MGGIPSLNSHLIFVSHVSLINSIDAVVQCLSLKLKHRCRVKERKIKEKDLRKS